MIKDYFGKVFFKVFFNREDSFIVEANNKNYEEGFRINIFGDKIWENALGEYHREEGPAIERVNGDREWWINGKLHREGLPACEYGNGSRAWYNWGKFHRVDGPASESIYGNKAWYIEGKEYSLEEYDKFFTEERDYTEYNKNGDKFLKKFNGEIKEIEYSEGDKEWYKDGEYHREDGPAIEFANGYKEWWIEGERYREEEFKNLFTKEKYETITINGKMYKLVEM